MAKISKEQHPARKMLLDGVPSSEIRRNLGISLSTLSYHRRMVGLPVGVGSKRYDWAKVQIEIDAGKGVREICRDLGLAVESYYKAMRRGAIKCPPRNRYDLPLVEFLTKAQGRKLNYAEKTSIKDRMVCEGVAAPGCRSCGLTDWMGQKLTLQLEHKDGNPRNNALTNLEILCPNCHSLTPTWGNKKRTKVQ